MSATGLEVFDATLQATHLWLNDVASELGWKGERHRSYHALRAVLHALRDRLPVGNVAHLAAQLPMLIRGFYYEGWRPSESPNSEHTADEFLTHVTEAFLFDVNAHSMEIAQAVFRVMARHISNGEIDKIKRVLPAGIRQLWPET